MSSLLGVSRLVRAGMRLTLAGLLIACASAALAAQDSPEATAARFVRDSLHHSARVYFNDQDIAQEAVRVPHAPLTAGAVAKALGAIRPTNQCEPRRSSQCWMEAADLMISVSSARVSGALSR